VTQGATTEVVLRTPQTEPLLPGWLPPRLVIPAARAYKVGFAFDADGGGRVVLARCEQHDIFVAVRTIDGPWRKPRRLPDTINTPGREEYPVVSFSPDGTIWLAYLSVGPVKYNIFVTRSRDGKDWEMPRVAASSKHRPDRILFKALRDDRAVIIWRLSKYRQSAQVGEALYATTVPRSGAVSTATISRSKVQNYSTVRFLPASNGVWHVSAGRRIFSSRDEGKTWKASGAVKGGVPHYAHVLGLLEPTPGTYWVRMISRQGPLRYGLFESTDLVQTRRLLEFPERLKAFTLLKRGGYFWILAANGFTRTIKPGLPFLTGDGGKRP